MDAPFRGFTSILSPAVGLLALGIGAFTPSNAAAQTLSLGSARTEAERAALRVAVEYAEQVGDIFRVSAPGAVAGGSFRIVDLSPSVQFETGDEDAFHSVIAKITGNVIFGPTTTVGGLLTPCSTCFFHVLTLSGGFESDRGFDNTAFLAEVGYVPWFQNKFATRYPILASSSVALVVQGGYKADTAGSTGGAAGPSGASDRSAEDPHSSIVRLRIDYRLSSLPLLPIGDNPVQLLARASAWRDLVNGEWYHRVETGLRITLTENQSFDLLYEEGAGAPTFNEGEQFSANLSIAF